jgi:type I restriction enzyme M protein
MGSPLSVKKNNYLDNPKKSDIHTPEWLSKWLYDEVVKSGMKRKLIFDPSIGGGALTNPYRENGSIIMGCDIEEQSKDNADYFCHGKFEDLTLEDYMYNFPGVPDLIVVNPPFNSATGRKLYPEVFLRKIDEVFGTEIPVIMICPMGMTLNQRLKSARWKYIRNNWKLTTYIPLPIDVFDNVLFHAQILCFNIPLMPACLWIPEEIIPLPKITAKE